MANSKKEHPNAKIVDLFCGIGGLTRGLLNEGLNVVAGIDNDETCKFGYEKSNGVTFFKQDIQNVKAEDLIDLFGKETPLKILVGCAPCQPFSKLNQKQLSDDQLQPLEKFAQLIDQVQPDIVSMENVSGLANVEKYPVFQTFLDVLKKGNYKVSFKVINAADYGVPQTRRRLVLLASKLGDIELIKPTHLEKRRTVRDTIKGLPAIRHGKAHSKDHLHYSRKLSEINMRRIRATRQDGGNSSTWEDNLILECHKKKKGKTYSRNVYARMWWDKPAPSITTQCIGLGNGRYGHPTQSRAISLREAALLQTFPKSYIFQDKSKPLIAEHVARFIGNAVPVRLGEVIGQSILEHAGKYGKTIHI
jgi:DNA (cytosine-5)-methyltransferase 1